MITKTAYEHHAQRPFFFFLPRKLVMANIGGERKMPKQHYCGYWTEYSYCGRMPNGEWKYFCSPEDYKEAFDQESGKPVKSEYKKGLKDWSLYMKLKEQGLI